MVWNRASRMFSTTFWETLTLNLRIVMFQIFWIQNFQIWWFQISRFPDFQIFRLPDFQTPAPPPYRLSDPNLIRLLTIPGIKYVERNPCCGQKACGVPFGSHPSSNQYNVEICTWTLKISRIFLISFKKTYGVSFWAFHFRSSISPAGRSLRRSTIIFGACSSAKYSSSPLLNKRPLKYL